MILFWFGVVRAEVRTWTVSTGERAIEAEIVELTEGTVTLKKADRKVTTLPPAKLSEADKEIARKLALAITPDPGETIAVGDEEHIAAIKKQRGRFNSDFTGLTLAVSEVTEAGLVHFKGMTGLSLYGPKVTDVGSASISSAYKRSRSAVPGGAFCSLWIQNLGVELSASS